MRPGPRVEELQRRIDHGELASWPSSRVWRQFLELRIGRGDRARAGLEFALRTGPRARERPESARSRLARLSASSWSCVGAGSPGDRVELRDRGVDLVVEIVVAATGGGCVPAIGPRQRRPRAGRPPGRRPAPAAAGSSQIERTTGQGRISSSPPRNPVASPPMWAAWSMFGTAAPKSVLKTTKLSALDRSGREHGGGHRAAVDDQEGQQGSEHSEDRPRGSHADPHRRASPCSRSLRQFQPPGKVAANARLPKNRSTSGPMLKRHHMFTPRWIRPPWMNTLAGSRHHSCRSTTRAPSLAPHDTSCVGGRQDRVHTGENHRDEDRHAGGRQNASDDRRGASPPADHGERHEGRGSGADRAGDLGDPGQDAARCAARSSGSSALSRGMTPRRAASPTVRRKAASASASLGSARGAASVRPSPGRSRRHRRREAIDLDRPRSRA